MSIAIQCSACGATFTVADQTAGRRVKCRQCGGTIAVPGSVQQAARQPAAPASRQAAPVGTQTSMPAGGAPLAAYPPQDPLYDLPAEPNLAGGTLAGGAFGTLGGTQPFYGGSSLYGGGTKSGARSMGTLALAAGGLLWVGFAGCEAIFYLRFMLRVAEADTHGLALPTLFGLFTLLVQVVCIGIMALGIAATSQRLSWGPSLGLTTTNVSLGTAFAWLPPMIALFGLAASLGGFTSRIEFGTRFLFRFFVDASTFIFIPAGLVFAFRNHLDRSSRQERLSSFTAVMAAATTGWPIYAVIVNLTYLLILADALQDRELAWRPLTMLLSLFICLLAAGAMIASGVGLWLRQSWAYVAAMSGSIIYILSALLADLLPHIRDDMSMPNFRLGHVIRIIAHAMVPVIILIWSVFNRESDDW